MLRTLLCTVLYVVCHGLLTAEKKTTTKLFSSDALSQGYTTQCLFLSPCQIFLLNDIFSYLKHNRRKVRKVFLEVLIGEPIFTSRQPIMNTVGHFYQIGTDDKHASHVSVDCSIWRSECLPWFSDYTVVNVNISILQRIITPSYNCGSKTHINEEMGII